MNPAGLRGADVMISCSWRIFALLVFVLIQVMAFLLMMCYMPFGRSYGKDGETYIVNPRPKSARLDIQHTMKALNANTPESVAAAANAAAGTMFAVCLTGATRGLWDLTGPYIEQTILKGIGASHVHIFAHVQTPDTNEIADMEARFGRQVPHGLRDGHMTHAV